MPNVGKYTMDSMDPMRYDFDKCPWCQLAKKTLFSDVDDASVLEVQNVVIKDSIISLA